MQRRFCKSKESRAIRTTREVNGISSNQNAGQEEIRVKIKLFETCLVPAILYEFEARRGILKSEMYNIHTTEHVR